MRKKSRRKFTDEFKDEAVKLVTEQGYSIAEASRNLGINPNILGQWKKELASRENDNASSGNMVTMQAELTRLRKEYKQLKMEREILKKAAVDSIGRCNTLC